MYTINSYRNNLIISTFLWRLLHFKHLWWSYVRWEFVLLSILILTSSSFVRRKFQRDIHERRHKLTGEHRSMFTSPLPGLWQVCYTGQYVAFTLVYCRYTIHFLNLLIKKIILFNRKCVHYFLYICLL